MFPFPPSALTFLRAWVTSQLVGLWQVPRGTVFQERAPKMKETRAGVWSWSRDGLYSWTKYNHN